MSSSSESVYRTVVTVRFELVHTAASAGEADLLARRVISSQPGVRDDQVERVTSTPLDLVERLQADNVASWQESEALKGHPEMYQRWGHGLLPESELLDVARDELFKPMAAFPRRKRLGDTAVPHRGGCSYDGDPEYLVTWRTDHGPSLTRTQYARLAMREAVTQRIADHPWLRLSPRNCVTTQVRDHIGTCTVCRQSVSQRSVLVTVQWAGRTLSREYLL